jgi:endonuclease YncB( thermonuclease family)
MSQPGSRPAVRAAVAARLATCALAAVVVACGGSSPPATLLPTAPAAAVATHVAATDVPAPISPRPGLTPIGALERATVVRVVDGDTIRVDRGRGSEAVRYIGIDAPETVRPNHPVEWMGPEAASANAALVSDREVLLERDVSDADGFGRLLRYVWVELEPGGLAMVNLELVARGYAAAVTYPPDVRWTDALRAAQAAAREAGLGLWGDPPP